MTNNRCVRVPVDLCSSERIFITRQNGKSNKTLTSPNACLVVPSPSSHPFSQTQGRPKRDRRPAGGVFAPGWAPDPAPTARNDSARESEEDGEDGEDSGDADDAASLDGVSDGEESEEDEEDSDEDSGKGPRGAGGGAGGVASAGDENSDLEDSGYAPSEAGDTDGDTDDDTTNDECSSTGGETRCEGCEEDFYCELVECPTCNSQYCQDCENDLSSDKEVS